MRLFSRYLRLGLLMMGVPIVGMTIGLNDIQWRTSKGDGYSPFEQRGYYHRAMISLQFPSTLVGDYYMGIGLQQNREQRFAKNPNTNQTIHYFISAKTNTNEYILDWPLISSSDHVVPFSLNGNNPPTLQLPIYIWVDPGQYVTPGVFYGELPVIIYKGPFQVGARPEVVARRTISLSISVNSDIDVSLGTHDFESMTDFNVVFESLHSGATVSYDAIVHAVGSYELMLTSKNKGALWHHLDTIQTKIPYQVYLDGQFIQFDEDGIYRGVIERGATQARSRHKIRLILGDVGHAFKGDYSDRLSIGAQVH